MRENNLGNTLSNTLSDVLYPLQYPSRCPSDLLSDILSDTSSNVMDGWPARYPWMDAWLLPPARPAFARSPSEPSASRPAARHQSMDSLLAIHPSYRMGNRIGYQIAYRLGYRMGYWIPGYKTSDRVLDRVSECPDKGQWDMRENHPVENPINLYGVAEPIWEGNVQKYLDVQ